MDPPGNRRIMRPWPQKSPHHSPLTAITPQCVRPGFWISSLLSYGTKGNTCPTKPLCASSRATPSQQSDSLVNGFRSNPKWTKAQSAYIRDRNLNTYADIVTWSGTHWTWRLLDLPQSLQKLLLPVPLTVEESIPLLPGQAWHLIAPHQPFSNRITEILSVSLYLTPRGYTVDVLYRHWILPQADTSCLPRTIISSVSPPQLYHGPIDHASWF